MKRTILVLAIIMVVVSQAVWAMPVKPFTKNSFEIDAGYIGSVSGWSKLDVNNFASNFGGDITVGYAIEEGRGVSAYVGGLASSFTTINSQGAPVNVNFHFSDFGVNMLWTQPYGLSYGAGIVARAFPVSWNDMSNASTTNIVGLQGIIGYNGRKPGQIFGLYSGMDLGCGPAFTEGNITNTTVAVTYDAEAGVQVGITNNLELTGGMIFKGMSFPSDSQANFALYGYRFGLGYAM